MPHFHHKIMFFVVEIAQSQLRVCEYNHREEQSLFWLYALGQPGSGIGTENGHDPSGCGVRMAQYAQENLVRKFATIFFWLFLVSHFLASTLRIRSPGQWLATEYTEVIVNSGTRRGLPVLSTILIYLGWNDIPCALDLVINLWQKCFFAGKKCICIIIETLTK